MKLILLAMAVVVSATPLFAAPEEYTVDPSHSQVVFSYSHAGFSTTFGMFSGFEGVVMFDQENPENSSVSVSIATEELFTGWSARDAHFETSGNFFNLAEFPVVTFASTGIEVTGEETALISGDLTLNGVTQVVVLDARLNALVDDYPFPPFNGKAAAGFSATATLIRSDFNLGLYAPYIADEVELDISIEAMKLN